VIEADDKAGFVVVMLRGRGGFRLCGDEVATERRTGRVRVEPGEQR
jgi:hypothetical protein